MAHEKSETVRAPYLGGRGASWINVYGKGTKKAGQQLPILYDFEQPAYATAAEAVKAAQRRSQMLGRKGHK